MNRATVALLLAMLSWGLSLTTADLALAHLSPADLLLLETSSGTAVVATVCLLTGRRVSGDWRPAFALGALEPGIAYVLANLGLALTSAAVGSTLFALESVFVSVIAWVILRNRPRQVEVVALTLGVIGTVLVATAGAGGGHSSGWGITFMVLSTLTSAGYVYATRRFAGGQEPIALVTRQGAASLMITAPFILGSWAIEGSRIADAPVTSLLLAGLTGVLGFALPLTLWTVSVPQVRPGFAAVSLNLMPLFGVLSATLLGQGTLSAGQWLGGGLILTGVVLLTRSEIRSTPPAPPPEPGAQPLALTATLSICAT
jgi:drug/metabolite transporter (DMT)-like permease